MKSYAIETAQYAAAPADTAQNGEHEAISTPTARTFAILDLVAHSPVAVDVASVIETLALPKATAYRLVDGLVSSGYLAREPVRKRLTVGSRLTDLAFGTMRASMRDASRHALLRRLAHQVNERFQPVPHITRVDPYRHQFHFQPPGHRLRKSAFIKGFLLETQRVGFQRTFRMQRPDHR